MKLKAFFQFRLPALLLALCFILQMAPAWVRAEGDEKPDTKAVTPSATVSQIDELFTARSWDQHPRILANSDDFARIRKNLETDPYLQTWYARIYRYCVEQLTEPVVEYEIPDGVRLLGVSRQASYRITWMAFLYQVSGEQRFAQRAVEEMMQVCSFSDWNPSHYLDVAQMCYGVGIGYDWLYYYMSDAQRKTVSTALYKLAVSQQQDQSKSTYLRTNSNWNPWCNAGLSIAACAIYENYPSQCSFVLSKAVTNVQNHNATLTPAGSYAEGPGYYQLGAGFMVILMETMRSVLGTDFGLSDMEGIMESGQYLLAMNGYSNTFNFGDGNAYLMDGALLHWYANRFHMPELSLYQRSMQTTSVMYDEYLSMLWYSPELVEGYSLDERQPDHFLLSDEYESIASFRGFGGDATQIYAGIKSGMNNNSHTDLDVGDFVLEALGERWITEMGSDNYNLPGYSSRAEDSKRWTYYRKRAEGQNTLVVKPNSTGGQAFDAKCQIVSYESAYDGGYAVVDMLDAYDNYGVTQSKRALVLFDNRSRVLIRDELKINSSTTVYWFAHTEAEITISADGKTAELTKNGKKLIAQIAEPSNAVFTSMTADPLSTSPASVSGENSREGFRKLVICLKNVTSANIAVVFTPVLEESDYNKSLPKTTIANMGTVLNAYEPGTTLSANTDGVYEIYDAEDLMCFASMVNSGTSFSGKQVRLMNDIDLKGRTFAPIGGSGTSNSFKGTFDGQGHVVKNLFIYRPGVGSVGFFGRTSGATIKNFGIESGTVYCGEKSGGLTGLSSGITIEKCFNKAKVISSAGQCGGLVGQIGGTNTITDSYNYANISSTSGIAGGIVGYAAGGTTMTLTNCYHVGDLSDSLGRCGLIGFYNTTAADLLVTKVTVKNCYATTAIKSSAVTDSSSLESYTDCAQVSMAVMPSMAVTLGNSFIYDCEYENANAPVLAWQCDTTLPGDLVLETAAQLRLFAYKVNTGTSYSGKTVKLGNNIDLDSVEWIPIGGNTTANGSKGKIFKGTFDGQGYSISNLSVTTKRFYVGFFGSVQGTVKNLGIQSGRVIGDKKVAGLAGYFSGTMENCYNRAAITGGSHTGGLIGSPDALTMTNCYNMGTVKADLVGGGLMGWLSASSSDSVIRNCYNGGSVSGSTVGALAVDTSGTNIQFINCHGLTGTALMYNTTGCTLTGCTQLSETNLKAAYTTLGDGFTADNYFPENGGYPILIRSVYPGEELPTLTPNAEGVYEIHTAQELRALAYMVNVCKKTFDNEPVKLCGDIDLAHEEWVPIGGNIGAEGQAKTGFAGDFDGNGHRIYNMDITTGNLYVGLFGFTSSATIQNVGVESGTIIGSDKVGAIVGSGRNYTKILSCYNRATVSSRTAIGGIVGMIASTGCEVRDCYNAGSVSGNNTVGGIVGYFASDAKNALVENCYNRESVAGGIVGSVNAAVTTAEIRNCYTLDTTPLAASPSNLIVTNCAQVTLKDLRGSVSALGTGYGEDYFVQNRLYPVLAWENAGRKTTLTKANGVYEIRTADDLRLVSYMLRNGENFYGDTLEMKADIDLEGKAWTPIGGADETSSYQFRGTFDGRGHRIYNLRSTEWENGYAGLFGSINAATVKNLGLESGMIVGSKRTGALFGTVGNNSVITNCYTKATVYAPTNIGAIVGYLNGKNVLIENCYNTGIISSKSIGTTVGGLIGGNSSNSSGLRMRNCYSVGYHYALVGSGHSSATDYIVENCYAANGVNLVRLKENIQFINSGIISVAKLKSYASVLGSAYETDAKRINSGYPILTWESGTLCYHEYDNVVVTAPTCTAKGYTTYTCSRCGHSYEDQIVNATGHIYTSTVTKAPTFTAKGTMTYTCKNDKTHTYTEAIDTLSKSLFFDFDNSTQAQERYQNYVYNFRNFDSPDAWRGRTQGMKNGNLTMDTATSSVTVTPKVTGFNSIYADSVNFDLNYDPDYAEYFQMRFKVTGLVGTKPKASIHFYYSTDNSYVIGTGVNFDVSYVSSGEYIVITGQLQDEIRQLDEVNRVILHLTGFTAEEDLDAVLTLDYAFVGPYEELPIKNSLFFDFTDKESDRIRYNSRTYGYTDFDDLSKLNWSYPTFGVSELIADSANDTVTIKAKGSFNASSWPAVYMDTYSAANKNAYTLQFAPEKAEYYQIRFKMKNFRVGDTETTNDDGSVTVKTVEPYLSVSFTEKGSTSSTSGSANYKAHAEFINGDTWIVATVPLNSAFKSAEEITRIRVYFGGIESISDTQPGEITIDYVFVGPYEELPDKKDLFFDFTDTQADRIRYNSRTYGYTNFDDLSKLNWTYPSSGVSELVADKENGTVTIKAKGTFNASSWPAVYMDTYDAGNKNAYPLHFDPAEAEYFQIRFKMKNFRIGETETTNEDGSVTTNVVNPYLKVSFTEAGTTSSVGGTADFKGHTDYINSDTWFTATVPLNSAFKSAKEITRIRLYFAGIESISETQPGEITVDYVYVGKLSDLPTPAYTVTFVDGNGKTLATQLVNRGESATYTGKTPTKASDATNHYTYKGWDKALTNITADITITATFTAEAHSYTYATTDTANHKATCSCGYSKSETHSYEYKATKNPTTSATGTLTGTCSVCSGTTTVTLPKLNTTDYTKSTTKAPTCTATGTDKYTWKTTTYGTFFFNVTTKAKGHTEVVDKAVAPTCTATGLTEGKHCSICNTVLTAQETVGALGHDYKSVVTAPTCGAEGYTTHTCSRCGHSYVDTKVSATGHSYEYKATKNPTTSATGTLTGTCSACGGTTTVTLPKLNTTDYIKTTTKAPTCTATGTDKYTWKTTTYGTFYFNVITKAKGHTEVVDKAVAPTCSTTGLTEGKHCSVCNAVLTAQEVVPAKGHTEVTDKAVAPTCSATGLTEGKHCSVCNTVLTAQETVAALGHDYKSVVTAPTCGAEGYTTHTCSRCGHSYVDTKVSATGHSYDSGTVTTKPTLTEKGVLTYTCTNDKTHTYTEELEVLSTSLFFDFDNSLQERYQNYAYGFVQFDRETEKNWVCSSSVVKGITVDNNAGTVTLKAKGTLEETTWPAVYMDTNMGSTGNKDPLHFDPSEAEYYQIRFKMKNFRIGDEIVENEDGTTTSHVVNPYLKLSFFAEGSTSAVAGTSDFKAHAGHIDSDTWFVATVPLRADFKNATEINRLRIYFGGIESISEELPGEVVIDYIYIGKLADLPTPAYTVTFTDGNGKTLATQLVNRGESATYTGKNPTRASDATNHYTFKGWDQALTDITADTTIIATFAAEAHSYTYATIDATEHKATCPCGYSKVETHSYENGLCICGHVEVKEPVEESTWKLGHSLNLASDISINYAIQRKTLEGYDLDTVYILAEIDSYKDGKYSLKEVKLLPVVNGSYYYFTLSGLTAVNMNDEIRAVLYGTKDGQVHYSPIDTYSVATYAYAQLGKANAAQKLKVLCAELLRYGAKAQIFKSYRLDALVDVKMTEEQKSLLSDMEAVTFGNTNLTENIPATNSITWLGKSLDLASKVSVKFIFSLGSYTGSTEDLTMKVTYKDVNGKDKEKLITDLEIYNASRGYYAFTLDSLLAAELRSVLTVQILSGDTVVSGTLQYAADTYGNGKTDALGDLCKALFAYSDSAKAYFAN